MTVEYFLSKGKDEDVVNTYTGESYICFGDLFWNNYTWTLTNYDEKPLYFFDYIHFHFNGSEEDKKCIDQIVEKFQWMKEVFFFEEKLGYQVWSFDLSKPADTVWFCLNLVRLIQQDTTGNSVYFKDAVNNGLDFWKGVVIFNSMYFAISFKDSRKTIYSYSVDDTCLLSLEYLKEETIQAVLEDPIKVLNKLPSVIESKTGFKPIVGYYDESGEFSSDVSEYCDESYSPMQLVMEDFHTKMIDPSEVESLRKHSGNHLLNLFNLNEDELRIFEKSVGELKSE